MESQCERTAFRIEFPEILADISNCARTADTIHIKILSNIYYNENLFKREIYQQGSIKNIRNYCQLKRQVNAGYFPTEEQLLQAKQMSFRAKRETCICHFKRSKCHFERSEEAGCFQLPRTLVRGLKWI
jgi:hypothetical protein